MNFLCERIGFFLKKGCNTQDVKLYYFFVNDDYELIYCRNLAYLEKIFKESDSIQEISSQLSKKSLKKFNFQNCKLSALQTFPNLEFIPFPNKSCFELFFTEKSEKLKSILIFSLFNENISFLYEYIKNYASKKASSQKQDAFFKRFSPKKEYENSKEQQDYEKKFELLLSFYSEKKSQSSKLKDIIIDSSSENKQMNQFSLNFSSNNFESERIVETLQSGNDSEKNINLNSEKCSDIGSEVGIQNIEIKRNLTYSEEKTNNINSSDDFDEKINDKLNKNDNLALNLKKSPSIQKEGKLLEKEVDVIKREDGKKDNQLIKKEENLKKEIVTIETITLKNGSTYSGEIVNGLPNGKGVEFRSDKISYKGDFKNGKWHGVGYIVDSNLDVCEGEFMDGEPVGF